MISEHNWFYLPPENISKTYIIFPKESGHHAVYVLRKKEDEIIHVTDGQGNLYIARMVSVHGSSIKAEILEKQVMPVPDPPYIDLAFVPLKGSRTEFIIEKGKELGVRRFLPFISQHAVIKQLRDAKIERFKHVMISAMKQSQQCTVSPIIPVNDVRTLVKKFKEYHQTVVADPSGQKNVTTSNASVLLIVGPEGGFDREELELFRLSNADFLSLGGRRLRSETAAIAGITKVLMMYDVL